VLGEDLTKFRNASKELYLFVKDFVWGGRVEKLGFDEVCNYVHRSVSACLFTTDLGC
jgi:hypothetical protein